MPTNREFVYTKKKKRKLAEIPVEHTEDDMLPILNVTVFLISAIIPITTAKAKSFPYISLTRSYLMGIPK